LLPKSSSTLSKQDALLNEGGSPAGSRGYDESTSCISNTGVDLHTRIGKGTKTEKKEKINYGLALVPDGDKRLKKARRPSAQNQTI